MRVTAVPSSYELIFRVVFEHAFFADSVLRDIRIVPVAACHDMLKRAGVQLQRQEDGMAAYGDAGVIKRLRLHIADAGAPLEMAFQVFFTDPQFARYTAPAMPPGHVLFLNTGACAPDPSGRQMLHATPCVPASACLDRQDPTLVRILGARVLAPAPAMVLQVRVSEALLDAATPALRRYHVRLAAAGQDSQPGQTGQSGAGAQAFAAGPRAGWDDGSFSGLFQAQRDVPAWESALAIF